MKDLEIDFIMFSCHMLTLKHEINKPKYHLPETISCPIDKHLSPHWILQHELMKQ